MRVKAERRSIELPERRVRLSVLDFGGEGPLALLHHANGFCAALWEPVALQLARHYRVIAFDARGHGDSSVPDPAVEGSYHWVEFIGDALALVAALIEAGSTPRVAYAIGHSFGGTTLMAAASSRPKHFERVAMVDPVIVPAPGTAGLPPMDPAARPPLAEIARGRRRQWPSRAALLERWAAPEHAFSAWTPRARELYAAEGFRDRDDGGVELKCAPEVEAAVFANNASLDPFSYAPALSAPTLLLWATRGNFPRLVYERFAEAAPAARVQDVTAGHLAPMEAPEETSSLLLRFAGAQRNALA